MKRIRYLTTLLVLLLAGSTGLRAQGDAFNPADPPEPGQPAMRLDLAVSPSEAGSASGGGRYAPGTGVSLRAYGNTGFRFERWTDANGVTISTAQSFTYTKQEGHEQLTAVFTFDPDAPADPAEPATIMYYKLTLNATEGGTVSGGGSYLAGQNVTLRAYTETGFDFDGWYDADGTQLSASTTFTYTTTAKHRMLTALFVFNPDNPVEPTQPTLKPKHTLTATATEGGSTSWVRQRLQEGESVVLEAYANTGYIFTGWYLNGEPYTTLKRFSYTVTAETIQSFEARFEFDPDSPAEPGAPTTTKHAFFLMNKVTKPGTTVQYPIYLSNVRPLGDMTFQLTFPPELTPDLEQIGMSARATGYTVSCSQQNDTTCVMSLVGGEVQAGNAALLVFTVPIPDNIATARGYQVKINQVSVTETDGTTITASTRNGRISVYKNGDANGDDVVDIVDVTSIISSVLGDTPEVFINEVANTNDDDDIDVVDVTTTIDIILGESDVAPTGQTETGAEPE